jgi:hypothetical protein
MHAHMWGPEIHNIFTWKLFEILISLMIIDHMITVSCVSQYKILKWGSLLTKFQCAESSM